MFFSCPVEIKPFPEMDAEAVLPLKHLQHILPLKSVFAFFNILKSVKLSANWLGIGLGSHLPLYMKLSPN